MLENEYQVANDLFKLAHRVLPWDEQMIIKLRYFLPDKSKIIEYDKFVFYKSYFCGISWDYHYKNEKPNTNNPPLNNLFGITLLNKLTEYINELQRS